MATKRKHSPAPGNSKSKQKVGIDSIKAIGRKSAMPDHIRPMLATLSKEVRNDENYLFEVKWDGYRQIAFVQKKHIRLFSRGGNDYTSRYPLVAKALQSLQYNAVLDGEIVVFDDQGRPNFNAVQLYKGDTTPITYYVFDILFLNGYDLREATLVERKKILQSLLSGSEVVKFSESFEDGEGLFKEMQLRGWEGVIAKRKDSLYLENDRSANWLKYPAKKMDEFVIGGWSESETARSFKSILFGAYEDGNFKWIGRSGGGFKEKEMPGILAKLKSIEVKKSPFVNPVLDLKGAPVHWVKPLLVANFSYAEMTESGRIRKPATWMGFRLDKSPKDVIVPVTKTFLVSPSNQQASIKTSRNGKTNHPASKLKKIKYLNADSGWKKVDEEQKGAQWVDFTMPKCTIAVHNLDRELWKGISKAHLLLYYSKMADYILPYIKDRPQSLNIILTKAGGPRTFIKDMENRQPPCGTVFTDKRRVRKEGKRSQIDYLVCNNKETLLFMVDLGCIDINPWASRIQNSEKPDYVWIDLDPTIQQNVESKDLRKAEEAGFRMAISVAKSAKKVLDKLGLTAFLKTSGKTGLHIYIPCSGFNYEQSRILAAQIADAIHHLAPAISTRNESVNQRGSKVYIDAGQNDYADTLAAPYSVRPFHEPLVSTPLQWKELSANLDNYAFKMDNIGERLDKKGDLFAKLADPIITRQNNKAFASLL